MKKGRGDSPGPSIVSAKVKGEKNVAVRYSRRYHCFQGDGT